MTVRLRVEVAAWGEASESFAWIVKLELPAAVGVPLMTPVLASANPLGSVPEAMLQA